MASKKVFTLSSSMESAGRKQGDVAPEPKTASTFDAPMFVSGVKGSQVTDIGVVGRGRSRVMLASAPVSVPFNNGACDVKNNAQEGVGRGLKRRNSEN